MKLRILATLSVALLFLTGISTSNAATIAGTKCTKVGSTKTTGGVKYFCVKSGKNLVWNKGTKVKVSASPTAKASTSPSASATTSATPTPSTGLIKLTLEEVKKHSDSNSCWSIVYDNVFDLTKWITKHPGGSSVIKAICGKDGSAAFEGQHQGEGKPARELSNYFLGKVGESIKG
jgi:cytochrome b involved in lipid metabolism